MVLSVKQPISPWGASQGFDSLSGLAGLPDAIRWATSAFPWELYSPGLHAH